MRDAKFLFLFLAVHLPLLAAPPAAGAQSAGEVLRTALRGQLERLEGVENYTLVQKLHGVKTTLYFERVETDAGPTFRVVPPHEVQEKALKKAGLSGGLSAAGGGAPGAMAGPGRPGALPAGGAGQPAAGGVADRLPGGLPLPDLPDLPGMPDLPGAGGDGSVLQRAGGAALGAAGGGLQQQLTQKGMQGVLKMAGSGTDELTADPGLQARMLEELARTARLAGTETVDGAECHVVQTDGIRDPELAREITGGQFEIRSLTMWIDAREYVPRRMVMEGRPAAGGGGGEAGEMRLELLSLDYRRVEGMYEPFRRVIRVSGLMDGIAAMDPEKAKRIQKDARESMAKREKLEEMLAQMPPEQRKMVEAQMGEGFRQVEAFVGGGDVETVIEVEELRVNAGPPSPFGEGKVTVEGDVVLELPHTIAEVFAGSDPSGRAAWGARLTGAAGDLSLGLLQLRVPGELPAGGEIAGTAGASFRWKDGREAQLGTKEGQARVRITSRDERRIRGEFSFRGTGRARSGEEAREIAATLRGTFEAPAPPSPPALPSPPGELR